MSLQSNINAWQGIYDNTGIYQNGGNPAYIGSVCATDGSFHQGVDIYQSGYKIYDFNWYAGQGVPVGGSSGGKFLVGSDNGFSWDTLPSGSSMKFCNDPAVSAQFTQLTQMLQSGFSYSAPGAGAGGCKSVSNRRSHGWHAARFRTGAGGHTAL